MGWRSKMRVRAGGGACELPASPPDMRSQNGVGHGIRHAHCYLGACHYHRRVPGRYLTLVEAVLCGVDVRDCLGSPQHLPVSHRLGYVDDIVARTQGHQQLRGGGFPHPVRTLYINPQ